MEKKLKIVFLIDENRMSLENDSIPADEYFEILDYLRGDTYFALQDIMDYMKEVCNDGKHGLKVIKGGK